MKSVGKINKKFNAFFGNFIMATSLTNHVNAIPTEPQSHMVGSSRKNILTYIYVCVRITIHVNIMFKDYRVLD